MIIYRIAKIIKQDPKLLEAARRVVEEGRVINDMAEEYHLNTEDLSEAVTDLRKMKSLPVDLILELFQKYKNTDGIKRGLRRAGLEQITVDDIIWVLRRKVDSIFRTTKTEDEKILNLIDQGKSYKEISDAMWIGEHTVLRTIKRLRPEDINTPSVDKDLSSAVINTYYDLVNNKNKTYQEAIDDISFDLGLEINKVRKILYTRGIKAGRDTPKKFTYEEKEKIVNELINGKNVLQIAKESNGERSSASIYSMLLRDYYDLYKKLKKTKRLSDIPENIKNFVIDSAKNKKTYEEIQRNVKENFGEDISLWAIFKLNKRWVGRDWLQFINDEISEGKSNSLIIKNVFNEYGNEISDSFLNDIRLREFPNDASTFKSIEDSKKSSPVNTQEENWTSPDWVDPKKRKKQEETPINFGTITREEYDKKKYLSKEEIEEMKRQKGLVASVMNWYRRAKITASLTSELN